MNTQPRVEYIVTLEPLRHELKVTLRISDQPAGTVRLETPTWVPGDYSFATYAREIFSCHATDVATGKTLPLKRDGFAGYQVSHSGGDLQITYCASTSSDFSESSGILDDRNGVLLGTRYLRLQGANGPCVVNYELPEGWQIHHPSGARQLGERSWEYQDYEQLLDTPVCFGHFDLLRRNIQGANFYFVFLNHSVGYENGVQGFVDNLVRVAEDFLTIFGSFPFVDYTFVMSLNPRDGWGLEHLSSTMVGLDPSTFYDADQYNVSIRVCAHELFHAWNVRRLRPAPLDDLRQYLETGCFTDGLWVAEGFTRYYEFLSCTRIGVYSPAQFFSVVTNYYEHLSAQPAYQRVSPEDASYASYLNHEKYPGRANNAIDYYDAGMVIAFELDAILRGNAKESSLDSLFAAFYTHYVGQGAGYTLQDICAFADEWKPGLGQQLREKATQPARLELAVRLRELGFAVIKKEVPYIGVIMQDDVGPAIDSVLDDSPAGQSGLASEDVVSTVNGYPYSLEALTGAIEQEHNVVLTILRGNQPHSYTFSPGMRTVISELVWEGNAQQAARIASWLRTAFDPVPGQIFALDFYENFHGIETVL